MGRFSNGAVRAALVVVIAYAAFVVTAQDPRASAAFTVNSTLDAHDADPGDGICAENTSGLCTLRAAFEEANALAGADTIIVPNDSYTIGQPLPVDETLTVNGASRAGTVVHGGNPVGAPTWLTISGASTALTLNHITFRDGGAYQPAIAMAGRTLTLSDTQLSNWTAGIEGAGPSGMIDVTSAGAADVTFQGGSVLTANTLNDGGTFIDFHPGSGNLAVNASTLSSNLNHATGGLLNVHPGSGSLTLNGAVVSANTADSGVPLMVFGPTTGGAAAVAGSTISGNHSGGSAIAGQGILKLASHAQATDSVTNATFSNNVVGGGAAPAASAGALVVQPYASTTLNVSGSTFASNTSGGSGGDGLGAGIDIAAGPATLNLTNSTLSGNIAGGGGGSGTGSAIATSAAAVLLHDTIAGNSAGIGDNNIGGAVYSDNANVRLHSTIVSSNTLGGATINCAGTVYSLGHNIENAQTCPHNGSGDQTADPKLAALAVNGGPTQTRALQPGSPAIDAADPPACPATDQRGFPRPGGSTCDVGAFEVQTPAVTVEAADGITTNGATLHGTINPRAAATTYHFDYGPTAAFGASTPDQSLDAGTADVPVSAAITGLQPATTSYYRLVATNAQGTGATGAALFTTANPSPPAGPKDLAVDFSFDAAQKAMSGAPVHFNATGPAADDPGVEKEWDFGDDPASPRTSQNDLDHPEQAPFTVMSQGAQLTHAFAVLPPRQDASVGSEDKVKSGRRSTYVVRLRVTDPATHQTAVVAHKITVFPNTAPVASFESRPRPAEDRGTTYLVSRSFEPDAPADALVKESWDLDGDGTVDLVRPAPAPCESTSTRAQFSDPLNSPQPVPDGMNPCERASAVAFNAFTLRTGLATFADLPVDGAEGTVVGSKTIDQRRRRALRARAASNKAPLITQNKVFGPPTQPLYDPAEYDDVEKVNEAAAAELRQLQRLICAFGCPVGDRSARLTVEDRSGAKTTITAKVPTRQRSKVNADMDVVGLSQAKAENGAVTLAGPVVADTVPGKGDGTYLSFDLSKTSVDRKGSASFYVLEVGDPYGCKTSNGESLAYDPKTHFLPGKGTPVETGVPGVGLLSPEELGTTIDAMAAEDLAAGQAKAGAAASQAAFRSASGRSRPVAHGAQSAADTFGEYISTPFSCAKQDYGVGNVVKTIVTRDPSKLHFTFPYPGKKLSVLLTVYDDRGASDKIRLDGFNVATDSGDCQDVAATVGQPDQVSFTGTCVSHGQGARLFWTKSPVDINGIRVNPACEGCTIVIDNHKPVGNHKPALMIWVDSKTSPKLQPNGDVVDAKTGEPWKSAQHIGPGEVGKAQLIAGGSVLAEYTLDPSPGKAGTIADLAGYGGPIGLPVAQAAEYKGFPVAHDSLTLTLEANGVSTLNFKTELPSAFASDPDHPPTSDAVIHGYNAGDPTIITKFGTRGARARARAAARARMASAVPSKVSLQDAAKLGDIEIPAGIDIVYDIPTDTWTGTFETSLMSAEIHLKIVISEGHFVLGRGELALPTAVPIIPGILSADQFAFQITTDKPPSEHIQLEAQLHYLLASGAIDGIGTLTLDFNPFHFGIDATANLKGIQVGHARIDIDASQLSFLAELGHDWGPVSVEASIAGAFSAKGFNIEGKGHGCLWVCLDIDSIVSNIGIALCGSIDVKLATISGGAGYKWKPGKLKGWMGSCDLSPYHGTVTRSAPGEAAGPLGPGGSSALIPVATGVPALAVQAVAVDGSTPPRFHLAHLNASNVEDFGYDVATGLGEYSAGPNGVFTDADPIAGTTTMIVAKPAAGNWKATLTADSAPVSGIEANVGEPPVTPHSLQATVSKLSSGELNAVRQGDKAVYGVPMPRDGHAVNVNLGKDSAVISPKPGSSSGMSPDTRLKDGILTAPDVNRLRVLDFDAKLAPGDQITFVEHGDHTSQMLGTYVLGAKGSASSSFVFDPARGNEVKRDIDAFVTNAEGVPRAKVHLDDYVAPAPAIPDVPEITGIVNSGTTTYVELSHGPSYRHGTVPEFNLVVMGDDGTVIDHPVTAQDYVHPHHKGRGARAAAAGGDWAVAIRGLSEHAQAKVRLDGIGSGKHDEVNVATVPRFAPALPTMTRSYKPHRKIRGLKRRHRHHGHRRG